MWDELYTDAIQQGLRQKGFEPVPSRGGEPTVMRVEIRSLDYDVSAGLWTAGNHAKSSVKVVANNGDQNYERMYRGQSEIRTAFVASQETNSKIINAAISEVLNRMFEDKELLEFLAR